MQPPVPTIDFPFLPIPLPCFPFLFPFTLSLFRWTVVEAAAPIVPEEGADETAERSTQTLDANSPTGEATWPVDVRVAERPPRRIRMGGGWGTDTSFRAELSWHHRNFYGGARHADVSVRYSGIGALVRPTFTEPSFLGCLFYTSDAADE